MLTKASFTRDVSEESSKMSEELTIEIRNKCILHWNCRGFKQLPDELKEGEDVKEIYLKWNSLQYLQSWVGRLKALTNLYLQHNQLKSLPEELGELLQLKVLDVTHNKLKFLTSSIGRLLGLTHLSAADNDLFCLPDEFQMLQSLKFLDLCGNNFSTIPPTVMECHALEEILLDNNYLTSLPHNIVYLPQLEILSVCGNNLLYLPYQPFKSNPSLFFENNKDLNHVSIWLGQQINSKNKDSYDDDNTWNLLGAEGCFQTQPSYEHPRSGILYVGDETLGRGVPLVLPSSLKYISSGKCCQPKVPPLLELSLRMVYSLFYHHRIEVDNNEGRTSFRIIRTASNFQLYKCLPCILVRQLKTGPVAICYHPYCSKPLFTYAVIWVTLKDFRIGNPSSLQMFCVLSTVIFCSIGCSEAYDQWERESNVLDRLMERKLNWFCKKE